MGDYYTIRRGMEEVFGKENILYSKGCDILGEENYINDAVKIAEKADVVVCVIGDCLAQNGEYRDRADLELSGYQTELVKRLIDTKKPVIAVLVNCKPLCISYLKENCNAIIEDLDVYKRQVSCRADVTVTVCTKLSKQRKALKLKTSQRLLQQSHSKTSSVFTTSFLV